MSKPPYGNLIFETVSYGRAYALPALRAWFSVRTEQDIQSCNELKRAKGPADNSHARKGVGSVADKDEG